MATVISTLYPPLVDTFQIPFLYTQDAEVYFTISPYNSYGEIKHLHITLFPKILVPKKGQQCT